MIPVLKAHRQAAAPFLVRLLNHPDSGWRKGAAAGLGRIRTTPARALPALLRMLKSSDATKQIMAIAALRERAGKAPSRHYGQRLPHDE